MPRRTVAQIYDEIELADSILVAPNNEGKPMKGIRERKAALFMELHKLQNTKQPGRYAKALEYIKLTEAIIVDLKSRGKDASKLESNLESLTKELEERKAKQRDHARKWTESNKDFLYEYHKGWRAKNKTYYNDYMTAYRQMKREQIKDTTPSSSAK